MSQISMPIYTLCPQPHPHHLQLRHYRLTVDQHRAARDAVFRTWREVAGVAAAV